ncbi:hypothetical protein JG688_00018349 [Phytophthora aleatoria]|uniref:Uncharacterized protein n=1 Tax=Phytophthora aleatoria TaxID=2496075 RepID=A0A8J5I8W8_9STRA|nr:hypothetical protein JG688_00018349 [Phytophthora aleatoria]
MSDSREGSYQILCPCLLPLLSTENSVALCRSWWPRSHFHWRTEYRYGGKNPAGTLAQTRRSIRCGWTSHYTDIINDLLWWTLQSEAFHAVLPARGPLTGGSQYAIITALAPTGRHCNAVLLEGKHPDLSLTGATCCSSLGSTTVQSLWLCPQDRRQPSSGGTANS